MNETSQELLSIGCSISVCSQDPECGFPAVVTDISPENIQVEIVNSPSSLPFKNRDVVLVTYWVEEELHHFGPTVLDVSGPNLVLSTPASQMDVQRRKTYRLGASLPLSYTVINSADSELVGQTVKKARTENISAGGLKFETDLPLAVGDSLAITLDLSPFPKMKAYGWFVWTKEAEGKGEPKIVIGLAFLQLEPAEQVHLLQFLTGFNTDNRRVFPRWVTSIPCTVTWKDYEIEGQISNLSFGGALVTRVRRLPPENTEVEIAFQAKERVALDAWVTSRVIHTHWAIVESGEAGMFGVTFEEPPYKLRSKLAPVLRDLFSEQEH